MTGESLGAYTRYCLNLQGYTPLSDAEKARIDLAQRFKPALCAILVLIGLFTASVPVVLVGVVLGYWGAFFSGHPFDLLYDRAIRPLLGGPSLGPDPAPRRFACGMVATLLLIGAISWLAGADVLGFVFVGLVALAGITLVVADFCVGSFTYWLLTKIGLAKAA